MYDCLYYCDLYFITNKILPLIELNKYILKEDGSKYKLNNKVNLINNIIYFLENNEKKNTIYYNWCFNKSEIYINVHDINAKYISNQKIKLSKFFLLINELYQQDIPIKKSDLMILYDKYNPEYKHLKFNSTHNKKEWIKIKSYNENKSINLIKSKLI
jgi:hypothetical protein